MGWLIVFAVVLLLVGMWGTTSRAGYESARYELEEKDGAFEVRTYESHEVVATSMSGKSQNGSFGKLFQYISGRNEGQQKIKMTTPVFMPASSEGTPQEMQFVIPQNVSDAGSPEPSNSSVKTKKMAGGKMAAIRFSGQINAGKRKEKWRQLQSELRERGITSIGSPIFAGYDPPWTPGPLRRNEVLVRIR